jgi:hypothetical protein
MGSNRSFNRPEQIDERRHHSILQRSLFRKNERLHSLDQEYVARLGS